MEIDKIDKSKCLACVKNRQCKNGAKANGLCNIHLKKKNIKLVIKKINKSYENQLENILIIQKYIRRFLIKYILLLRGPGTLLRKNINNDNDFVSYEDMKTIPIDDIITYQDEDNFIFGYDIKSVKVLLENNQPNPYTQKSFTPEFIFKATKMIDILERRNKNLTIVNEIPDDPEIHMRQKCVAIFQKMDELKLYTQVKWFLDLSLDKLKKLYIEIEDIWNWRAMLTKQQKLNYTYNGKAFVTSKSFIKKLNCKLRLQNILLDEFDKFLIQGKTQEDKVTASYWILTGLTIVSPSAAEAMPNIVQSF